MSDEHARTLHRTPLVEMRDISLAFGGVHAVERASIDLYDGEVVALVGHNGAGKSTLIKILSGAYPRDSGSICIRGEEATIANPRDAKRYGIETIYQTLALADNVDAAANLFLGRELARAGARSTTSPWRPRRARSWAASIRTSSVQGSGQGAVRRPAPVGGDRARDPVQRADPDHGRADGGARAAGDGAGRRTGPNSSRPRASASSSSATTFMTCSISPTGSA